MQSFDLDYKCPRCKLKLVATANGQGVENTCPGCGQVMVSRSVLKHMNFSEHMVRELPHLGSGEHGPCPACGRTMTRITLATGFSFGYCPLCQMVWAPSNYKEQMPKQPARNDERSLKPEADVAMRQVDIMLQKELNKLAPNKTVLSPGFKLYFSYILPVNLDNEDRGLSWATWTFAVIMVLIIIIGGVIGLPKPSVLTLLFSLYCVISMAPAVDDELDYGGVSFILSVFLLIGLAMHFAYLAKDNAINTMLTTMSNALLTFFCLRYPKERIGYSWFNVYTFRTAWYEFKAAYLLFYLGFEAFLFTLLKQWNGLITLVLAMGVGLVTWMLVALRDDPHQKEQKKRG